MGLIRHSTRQALQGGSRVEALDLRFFPVRARPLLNPPKDDECGSAGERRTETPSQVTRGDQGILGRGSPRDQCSHYVAEVNMAVIIGFVQSCPTTPNPPQHPTLSHTQASETYPTQPVPSPHPTLLTHTQPPPSSPPHPTSSPHPSPTTFPQTPTIPITAPAPTPDGHGTLNRRTPCFVGDNCVT